MAWLSAFAVYFILWWLVLFAVLPFSLRTQDEEGDVTLGTTASAPAGSHMRRAALRATIVSAILFGAALAANRWWGITIDDVARMMPGPG